MLRLRTVLSGALLAVSAVVMFTPAPASASLPPAIPSEMQQRAESWLAGHLGPIPYAQDKYFQGYREDCSGYMSMILGLPGPGLDTAGLAASSVSTPISKSALRFGDMLIMQRTPARDGHVVMFDHWTDSSHDSYVGYEQTNDGSTTTTHRTIPYPYFNGYVLTPYRYNNIVVSGPVNHHGPDFSGDGVADIVAVTSGGHMQYYPNNYSSDPNHVPIVGSGTSVDDGWNAYNRLLPADYSGDGADDLVALTSGGHMQYFPDNSASNANHVPFAGSGNSVGDGWNIYNRFLTADFSGDGAADMVAVTPAGHMQYYPDNSASNANHVPFAGSGNSVGDGWNIYSQFPVADFSGDGAADMVAVTPAGHMQYYPDNSATNANHVPFAGSGTPVGDGWNIYNRFVAADYSGDGAADLVAFTPAGHMQYYPDNSATNANHVPFAGSGFSVSNGWNAYNQFFAADFTADHVADLVVVTPGGHMQFFPNNSASNNNGVPFGDQLFGTPIGDGWNAYSTLLI